MLERKANGELWDKEKSRRIAALKNDTSTRREEGESRDCDEWDIVSEESSWFDATASLEGLQVGEDVSDQAS